MPYKKRRVKKAHNKNLMKVMRGQSEEVALGSRYPNVRRVEIQLDFLSTEGVTLSSEKREFEPSDLMDLAASCPGRCGNGRMDVEGKLEQVIGTAQTSSESRAVCQEVIYAGMNEVCGCQLRCRMNVEYLS